MDFSNCYSIVVVLTVNESIDEKKVPSSYLDNLESTPSSTATNCIKKHSINIHNVYKGLKLL